jgi:hypothetical protein
MRRFSSTRHAPLDTTRICCSHTAAGAPTIREGNRCDAVLEPAQILVTLEEGLKAMIEVLTPFRALARIKRFLRRACRKPADMPIRTHLAFPTS